MNITKSEILCAAHGAHDPDVALEYLGRVSVYLDRQPDAHLKGTWQNRARSKIKLAMLNRQLAELAV